VQHNGSEAAIRVYTRSGTLTAMSTTSAAYNWRELSVPWIWVRLTYQAADTWRKEISPDGISWTTVGISDMSKTMTPTHVGACWSPDTATTPGSVATYGPIVKLA